jgi:hypothetical protein
MVLPAGVARALAREAAERETLLLLRPLSQREGAAEVLGLRDSSLFRAAEDLLKRARDLLGLEEERALLEGGLDPLAEERFSLGLLDLVEEARELGAKDARFLAERLAPGERPEGPEVVLPSARDRAARAAAELLGEVRRELAALEVSGGIEMIRAVRRVRHRLLPSWSQDLAASAYFSGFVEEAWRRGMGLVWVLAEEPSCPEAVCRANAAEGYRPPGVWFSSGVFGPPAHPGCRCAVLPAMGSGESEERVSSAGVAG